MSDYTLVDLLSKDECNSYSSRIDSIKDKWIKRPVGEYHFYTLGTATHLDVETRNGNLDEDYFSYINHNNNILKDNFSDLYDKVFKTLVKILGPCEFIEDAPIPGFFIYGEKKNGLETNPVPAIGGKTNIHSDKQLEHLGYVWSNYSNIETDTIGFTLPIEVPDSGSAILLWDQPNHGFYMDNDMSDAYKRYDYTENPNNIDVLNNNIINKIPEVIEHIPGRMFLQHGPIWHAAGHAVKPTTSDRRITLQGFGAKCDGIWRLCF